MIELAGKFSLAALSTFAPLTLFYSTTTGTVFSLHPAAMVGMFCLQSVSFRQIGHGKAKKSGQSMKHFRLIVAGNMVMVAGTLAVEYTKFSNGYPHFVSWHSILGVIGIALSFVQSVGGFNAFFYPKYMMTYLNKGNTTMAEYWKSHRLFGLSCYSIMFGTLLLSLTTKWMTAQFDAADGIISKAISLPIFAGLLTTTYLSTVIRSQLK